ncbi:thermonuclease family protein [Methylobrevis pamukkalensis]|uniref:TNase-like domain-containing protein n=1 Tax=Methylobrevis pamukkalensis TaxID=1439726 RepID=A0A1E3H6X6_9HYPH|nr:thermonuclease family protein [Methylobrevis pamukkalensis]ODN72072.1 hypothetical protein A6302_00587 [Methylobrevis pamukkalensis]
MPRLDCALPIARTCLTRFLAAGLLAAGLALPVGAAERLDGPYPADVLEVVDGDTLLVRARIWLGTDVTVAVRLRGIDAPEARGRCPAERDLARKATRRLGDLVADGSVHLTAITGDKYGGRVVATVTGSDGRVIADDLLGEGLARPYAGRARAGWCGG